MARNGSGVYSLPAGNPVTTNTTISSVWANTTLSDIATALTQSVSRDGQTTMTNNLPMSGYKLTGLSAGTGNGESLRFEQLFSQGNPIDLAGAATTDIGALSSNFINITGSATITSLGTNYNGPKFLRFTGTSTLTYNATTLVTPTAANIVTVAGDILMAIPRSTASGIPNGWQIINTKPNDVIGNLNFLSSGARITGDFTNATLNNRVSFQTSTPNSGTALQFLPSGTARSSGIALYDRADPTNSHVFQLTQTDTSAILNVGAVGTELANIPLDIFVGGFARQRYLTGGQVVIGQTTAFLTADAYLYVRNDNGGRNGISIGNTTGSAATVAIRFDNSNGSVGSITTSGTTTTYNVTSDYRLKNNPKSLTNSGLFIDALKPKTWIWKETGEVGVGFIAHEFAEVSSSSVVGDKDAIDENGKPIYQMMDASSHEVMANIVAELQSLRKRVKDLENK